MFVKVGTLSLILLSLTNGLILIVRACAEDKINWKYLYKLFSGFCCFFIAVGLMIGLLWMKTKIMY